MADQISQDSAYHVTQNSGSLPSMASSIHNNSFVSDSLPISPSQLNTSCHIDENSDISNRVNMISGCDHIQSKNICHAINDEYHHNNSFSKSYSDIFTQPYLLQNHVPIGHQIFETYPHNSIVPMPMIQEGEELQWSQCYMPNYFTNQDPSIQQYGNRSSYLHIPSYPSSFYSTLQPGQTQLFSSHSHGNNSIFQLPGLLSTQSNSEISTNLKSKELNQVQAKSIDHRDSNNERYRNHRDSFSKENISSKNQNSNATKTKSPSSSDIAKMFETFHSSGEFKTSFYNPFEVKHRKRTSKHQFKILERAFQENCKPSTQIRRDLAIKLGMTMRGVQVWFQNRRAKLKNIPKDMISNTKDIDPKNKNNLEHEIDSEDEGNDFDIVEDCSKEYESTCGYTTLDEDIDKESIYSPKERINDDLIVYNQRDRVKQGKEKGFSGKQNNPSAGVLVFNASGEQIYQGVKLDSVNYNQSEKMISKIAHQSESKSPGNTLFNPALISVNINAVSPSSIHPLFPTLPTTLSDTLSNGKKRSSSYSSGTFSSIAPALYRKEQVYLHDTNMNASQFTSNPLRNTTITYDGINGSFNQMIQNTVGSEPLQDQGFPVQTVLPFHTHGSDIVFGQNLCYPYPSQYHHSQSIDGLNHETTSPVSRNRASSMPVSGTDTIFIPQPFQFAQYSAMDPSQNLFYDPYMPHYPHSFHAQATQVSHESTNIDTKLPEIHISDRGIEVSRHDSQQSMNHNFITQTEDIDPMSGSNRSMHDSRESLQFVSSMHSLVNTNPHEIGVFSGIKINDAIAKMNSNENGYIFDNIQQTRLSQEGNTGVDDFLYQHSMDRISVADSGSNEYETNHSHGNILNIKNTHDRTDDVDDVSYPVW